MHDWYGIPRAWLVYIYSVLGAGIWTPSPGFRIPVPEDEKWAEFGEDFPREKGPFWPFGLGFRGFRDERPDLDQREVLLWSRRPRGRSPRLSWSCSRVRRSSAVGCLCAYTVLGPVLCMHSWSSATLRRECCCISSGCP